MKKASSKYIFVLGILTLVILGSQLLMQTTIKGSKSDARIINISGRQRMLSQKITKASLKLQSAGDAQAFEKARRELDGAFTLWNQSHEDLQYGSAEIDVTEMNGSKELELLYEDIQPYFMAIKLAASGLVNLKYEDLRDRGIQYQLTQQVEEISANEASFLNLMNKITFQYDKQASSKIETLAEVEYYLMGITFLLILLEAFFIFRPMYKEGKKQTQEILELSDLRSEEKTYASGQITLANQRIKSLRSLAMKLKGEMDIKSDEMSNRLREQMQKYTDLAEEYEKLKTASDIRKGKFDRLDRDVVEA